MFHCDRNVLNAKKFYATCLQQVSASKKALCKHVPRQEEPNLQNEKDSQK